MWVFSYIILLSKYLINLSLSSVRFFFIYFIYLFFYFGICFQFYQEKRHETEKENDMKMLSANVVWGSKLVCIC